ncbi:MULTISPECIES: cytochrome o ubiquinol oxidase subunit IV [Novosphingopyxis]|uniref:cytochrome o ubiquinol oxidase subunit IV n=1 Tax=Novosphingopyxis TaxID=2709686 RepID=UPI000C5DEA3A|nr:MULTISPECIES: cytochrome o ubiquinol oxidase subunit IV [Novosphingopyxis]MAC11239.1 cytochrome o ubiquinol oxidase subunit IV [Sphingorhabdus sp.]MBH9538020.1 cytochrome o ubiquinol oxidase subunit IV [Novosphingopyxis sp. YJ-S2-01]
MSTHDTTKSAQGHDAHDHAHGLEHEEGHGSRKGYMIGFGLSVVLTAIPFWLVMTRPLTTQATALIILIFAAVQMVVHMVYFLHMNRRAEGGWSIMALIFTVVIVIIAFSGSLWVMYHMNANMMPMQAMSDM